VGIATAIATFATVSVREGGYPTLLAFLMADMGLALSAIEWRTHGRHRLAPLALAAAAATMLYGIGSTAMGLMLVGRYAAELADPVQWQTAVSAGVAEALNGTIAAVGFAALQIIAWALVNRKNQNAQ
jgi:hypothetical protein